MTKFRKSGGKMVQRLKEAAVLTAALGTVAAGYLLLAGVLFVTDPAHPETLRRWRSRLTGLYS